MIIFQPACIILAWGDLFLELYSSINDDLFLDVRFDQVRSFDECDHPSCTCPHRPYKNPSDKWSLQTAVATTLNRFLDYGRQFQISFLGTETH
jgi:hypothetical protein